MTATPPSPDRPASKTRNLSSFFGMSLGLISTIFVIRLFVDTSFRMIFPFIPQISEGLQISISALSWILSIRASSGLLGPFVGALADRIGRRKVMSGALIILGAGMAGVAFSTGWWSVLPLFLVGLGTASFFPAQQAYISDLVPFERRGRTLAFIETSFALSGIFLLPVVGWIFDGWGWQAPFWLLGLLNLVGALVIWTRLPKVEMRTEVPGGDGRFRAVIRKRGVLAALAVASFLFVSVSIYMTFWGIWLSEDFGFDVVALGLTATVISVGELTGSVSSALVIDRIGKRRGVIGGLFLGGVFFLLVPLLGRTPLSIRAILAATMITLEFSIVSLFPLYGEQAPEARATVFSLTALGTSIGFAVGPSLTTALWSWKGVFPVMAVGALCLFITCFLVWRFLFEDGGRKAS